MISITFIRENTEAVKKAVVNKGMAVDIDKLLALDSSLREGSKKIDALRTERNRLSKRVQTCSDNTEKARIVEQVRLLKNDLSSCENATRSVSTAFDNLMLHVPSIPAPEVPIGKDEDDNIELRKIGCVPTFNFPFRDHIELCEIHDMLDMQRGTKVAGSRSYFLKNDAVILEMAVCRFVIDFLSLRGFTPMSVPQLVREKAMQGTGYFPIGSDQAYAIPEDELFLAGTSEVSLVSFHQDETLPMSEFPIRYAGISSCYRREAGTYGKDSRGLYRVHQFQKVEQVVFCEADHEKAERIHYEILENTELILQALELPYRVCLACTGEIGIGQIRKHEVETWMPSRNAYCETHSCSTLADFQTRRLGIRYRDNHGEMKYAFTLNNTGIASPRILIPLLENHQNEDGSITIPKALRPYMNEREKIQ
ncbi:MAG: serine--tRNA ligase [Defluviitaleaceae bacterium]|nr:serine--tRNA ligase [Defluviitaleaceae bacterium]MCL2240647.1 serine--tRNA ligase [Defluviitaleaceae bacterium]